MKFKKLIALLLAVAMCAVMIAACGGDDTEGGQVNDEGILVPAVPKGNFNEAWAEYLKNYDGIADEIAALEQLIHNEIMREINAGTWAGNLTPGWGNVGPQALGTAHLPDHPDAANPVVFTMFIAGPGEVPDWENNRILKELTRITGVKLDMEYLVGDMDQKVGVMIASGDYPDYLAAGQARGNLLNAGAFANLDGLIQDYPNLWRHYGEYEQRVREATLDNSIRILTIWGRAYFMNDGEDWRYEGDYNGPAFWIQKDVLAWDGYSYPTTLDQFFDLLARYYAEHPTIDGQPTLPFEIHSQDWRSFCLKNPSQHLIGGRNEGDVVVNPVTYEVEIYQNKDYARRYYEKLNEVYHQGLINPETFTRNYDQYIAVISQGRVLAMFDQQWNFGQGEEALIAEGRYERTYVPLGLTWDRSEPYPYNRQTQAGPVGNNGGGISVSCKNVDRLLEFLDMMLMPEVQVLMYWGQPDVDFYVDNGRYRRTPEQKRLWDDRDWLIANTAKIVADELPKLEGRLPDGNAVVPGNQPEEKTENMYEYDKDFYSHYSKGGATFSQKADFLPLMEFPGYTEVWSTVSSMDSSLPERETFDLITDFQNRYLPGIIMSARP